jgi:nicotinamidase-related amidase
MSVHVTSTTPYPWPYDGDLDGPGTALLVVVPAACGGLPWGAREVVSRLGEALRGAGGLVVVAITIPSTLLPRRAATPSALTPAGSAGPLPSAGLDGTTPTGAVSPLATSTGAALLPEDLLPGGCLGPTGPDEVVLAGGIDAFYGSRLDPLLRSCGVERLLLAGVGLETCIHSTMRDANDRGYECLLVVDACVPVDPDLVPAAVSMIEMSGGIFGAVGRSADVLAVLTHQGALT